MELKGKKGIYFTMDALLASFLLMAGLLFIMNNPFYEQNMEQKSFISQDILNSLYSIKIYELNNDFITEEITNGNITRMNNSVLEQIGEYWAIGENNKANQLFELMVNSSLGNNLGVKLSIEEDVIFNKTLPMYGDIASSSRMITGITKGGPLTGFSSSAYLKKIRNKKTSSYAYFGGFVGQGNITVFIDDLPADIEPEKITNIYLEGEFKNPFYFKINDENCNMTGSTALFSSTLTIANYNLIHCNTSLVPGRNDFSIQFTGNINQSYIAGGMIKIVYRTDELQQHISSGFDQYYFPEIIGIANLYDAFRIPGYLTKMDVALHFKSSEQTYITIGERIIEIIPTGSDQWFYVSDDELLNTYNFDYDQLSVNTIPLRFASYNATTQIISSGNADIIIITDFSGSMKKSVTDWSQGVGVPNCNTIFASSNARKTHLARCLDNEMIDVVMNYTGNRVWPVFLHSNEIKWYNNPLDKVAVQSYISGFGPQGTDQTCLSCAINQAYNILNTYSNESRAKFIVFMTDGAPNYCPSGNCESTNTNYGARICEGFCDYNGASGCNEALITGCNLTDTSCEAGENSTMQAAIRAVNDLNATFFTVGFGLIEECDRTSNLLRDIADLNNGTYQHSKNTTELRMIYQNISQEVLTRVEQSSQSVSVQDTIVHSNLYGDSYINFTFTPLTLPSTTGKITVNFQEPMTTCEDFFDLPAGIELIDALITSYSGIHWADVAVVNDEVAFNLSNFYVPYYRLGDPFFINIPVVNLTTGTNKIFTETGDSPDNRTGCSTNNSFIYTALVPSVTARTDVKEKLEGCTWTVAFEDGTTEIIKVPNDYSGTKTCSYQPGNISYENIDTYDVAVYTLFRELDTDNNGEVLININNLDLEISTTAVGDIPYLWGPSLIRVEVSQ